MNLRSRAYESFTRHLLARDLEPGQFVSQRELVGLTGMPLGAIRELIPRLEADGLITTVPQRGLQVAQLSLKLIREAFQLRLFLEVEAVREFARSAPAATLERLRDAHEAVLGEAQAQVTPVLVERAQAVDWDLHDTIVDALGNDLLANVYRVNSIKIRLIRQSRTRLFDDIVAPVMQEHLRIIAALSARDADAAAAAMGQHITRAGARAVSL